MHGETAPLMTEIKAVRSELQALRVEVAGRLNGPT